MIDWWADNGPPVYLSVAGYLGLIKKKSSLDKPSPGKEGDLEDLARMFSGSGGMIQ